ncbi:MAG: NAD-dependent epimerase [Balneolaceae bacterium]
MKILVTGSAGFIGFHLVDNLIKSDHDVVGLDHLNDYYDINIKIDRLKRHGISTEIVSGSKSKSSRHTNYQFARIDLQNRPAVFNLFEEENFDVVVNLAAQAGVRHSLTHPQDYIDYNITGFLSILEACRAYPVSHLIYASSSSVYGLNTRMPFSVKQNVDHPVSLYAATKKANELMGHTYSHLFGIPTTGLRFFTVYGPWGRPDMALFLFVKAMLEGETIDVYNFGKMKRDFTYVTDITESIVRLIPKPPTGNLDWDSDNPDPSSARTPYQLFNIGNNNPVALMDFIAEIEDQLGVKAKKNLMEIQPGDVPATWADVNDLFDYIDYKPSVGIKEGVAAFVEWYRSYYNV